VFAKNRIQKIKFLNSVKDDSSSCPRAKKKDRRKSQKFLLAKFLVSPLYKIFLFRKAFGEEAAALFSLAFVRLSLRRILSTEEEREREWVLFLTETRVFTYLLG
jgi:hypothetical protein